MKKKQRTSKNPRMNMKLIVIILAVALVIVGGVAVYTIGLGPVDSSDTKEVTVSIPNGTGASAIIDILDDAGLVKNKTCAKIHVKLHHYDSLQANSYVFSKSMSLKKMMKAINTGDFDYISKASVEIIAGDRLSQIAEKMSEQLPYTADEFLAKWSDETYLKELIDEYWFLTDEILDSDILYPLEGYFYADTYYITNTDESIEEATTMFLDRMDTELTSRKKAIKKSGFTVHEFLTLTSIVTKEGGSIEDDLPTVAGVFINRLNKGMSLGSDVTVNYIYQEDKVNLKQSQLNSDSPYNTRKYTGLPPSPICSVLDSRMDAVLNYEKTDYLFFYGCPDGTVIFSKTSEEHEKAASENPWPDEA